MTIIFEQTDYVYQIETLVHTNWLGDRGIQTPYTYQTLEDDLKYEAVKIWEERKYDQNTILRNLTPENERRNDVVFILERLSRYRKTSLFEDVDGCYRDKNMMNDMYKKQLDKVEQLEQQIQDLNELIFPNDPYNFTELKAEINRLKLQELAPQIRKEKLELEQLITNAKNKVEANFTGIIDLLFKTQKQMNEKEKANDPLIQAKLEGELTAYQKILQTKLTQEELKAILVKQTELFHLEKHLDSLQQIHNQK